MADLISRAAAIKTILDTCPDAKLEGSFDEYAVSCLCGAAESLKRLPAVDAAPVVHGRWIKEADRTEHWHCSECGRVWGLIIHFMNYCPNCGAKLEGDIDGPSQ